MWCALGLCGFLSTLAPGPVAGNLITNVALNGKTSQSSLTNAARAIDGNRNGYDPGTCSLTRDDIDPWWRVDLLQTYRITAVIVSSVRLEDQKLDGAEVWLDTSIDPQESKRFRCAEVSSFPLARSVYVSCSGLKARFVTVVLPGATRSLSLCEVEVYSTHFAYPVPNVALKGEAVQSSTLPPAAAHRAIDGKRLSFYTESSCSHTTGEEESAPWWRVDLGCNYNIVQIKLTNRGDCCSERLDGAEIHITDSLQNHYKSSSRCATVTHIPPGHTLSLGCVGGGAQGRFVSVVLPGDKRTLTLCEVEVYAVPTVLPQKNVAFFKDTVQSSVAVNLVLPNGSVVNGSSIKAVRWYVGHSLTEFTCIQTLAENAPWWRVDLGAVYRVSAVTVYLRQGYDITGAEVRIGDTLRDNGNNNSICAVIQSPDLLQTFQCAAVTGRFVNVVLPYPQRSLTFCRMEVYGSPIDVEVVAAPSPGPVFRSVSVGMGDREALLIFESLCWSDALLYCRSHYWDLLSVNSQEEQRRVEQLLTNTTQPVSGQVWIGLRRSLLGVRWFGMTGEAVIFNQWQVYPLVIPNTCGAMSSSEDHSWSPQPCDRTLNFICQTAPAQTSDQVYFSSYNLNGP